MNKFKLMFLLAFISPLIRAQQAIVSLPAMNVIYIGLDNPVKFAVEGYTHEQLTISTSGCELKGTYPNTYLTANTWGNCKVYISYKKDKKTQTDTFDFRIKSIPKPEAMFGTLESGTTPAAALLAQNSIRAVMSNFVFEGVYFKVISYQWMFISNSRFTKCADIVKSDTLPEKLRDLISKSRGGDQIFIDGIEASGPRGIQKKLAPIVLNISGKRHLMPEPNLITFQKDGDSLITFHNFQGIFNCDGDPLFADGILKTYYAEIADTVLISEIRIASDKPLSEKELYPSGKLKAEYIFKSNDTLGQAILYYENGVIKSRGMVIARQQNIFEYYGGLSFLGTELRESTEFVGKFIDKNYAPIGNWKGYYENGTIALDCNFKIEGYADLEYELDFSGVRCGNHEVKFYSISEALKHPENTFYPNLSGPCKTYNRQGKLISEEIFKE